MNGSSGFEEVRSFYLPITRIGSCTSNDVNSEQILDFSSLLTISLVSVQVSTQNQKVS